MSSWLVNLLEGEYQSMVIDVVVAVTMNIHGVTSGVPPPKFDRPYPNVEIVFDLAGDGGPGEPWGWADVPSRPGGRCVIHLAPLSSVIEYEGGVEILEEVGLPSLLRHEHGHCWGLGHPSKDRQDEWVPIKSRSPKMAAKGAHGYKLSDNPRKLAELEATIAVIAKNCPTSGMNGEGAREWRQAIIEKGRKLARDFDAMLAEESNRNRRLFEQSGGAKNVCPVWRALVEGGGR